MNPVTSETDAEKLLETVAAQLGEHFDAVQIMVSYNREAQTFCVKRGCGNWYARQGMAHEFINANQAEEQARQIAEVIQPPEDDGDEWKLRSRD